MYNVVYYDIYYLHTYVMSLFTIVQYDLLKMLTHFGEV